VSALLRRVLPDDDLDALMSGTTAWEGADYVRGLVSASAEQGSEQFIAEIDGRTVGYAHCIARPLTAGGRGAANVWVVPSARGEGTGMALWRAAVGAARAADLRGLRVVADLNDERSLSIAAAHGLAKGRARVESRLDLRALDDSVIAGAIDKASAQGAELRLLDVGGDDEWGRFYEDFAVLFKDMPEEAEGRQPPSLDWVMENFGAPWQVLLARQGDRTVGMTMAFVRGDASWKLVIYFTGVLPAQRGKGLATALMAEHARRLGAAGWRRLHTWNLEGNDPIFAANARLGFVPVGGHQELVLDL